MISNEEATELLEKHTVYRILRARGARERWLLETRSALRRARRFLRWANASHPIAKPGYLSNAAGQFLEANRAHVNAHDWGQELRSALRAL